MSGTVTSVFSEEEDGGLDGVGRTSTVVMKITGEMQDQDHARVLGDGGSDGAFETIVAGDTVYLRFAQSMSELAEQKWIKEDVDALEASPETPQPEIVEALEKAQNPNVRNLDDGRRELSFTVDVADLFGAEAAEQIERITMTVVVDRDDRPVSMRQVMSSDGVRVTSDMQFSDWGADIKIVEPTADQIDPTPDIEEEALIKFKQLHVKTPASLPPGWTFDFLGAAPDEECSGVEVDFVTEDEDAGYMYMYFVPVDCLSDGGDPFVAGPYRGTIDTEDGSSWVEFPIDATTGLQVDTDMAPAELAATLRSLVPVDLTKL